MAVAGLACSSDETVAPDQQEAIEGLDLSAEVVRINTGGAFANGMILSVQVNVTNTTSQTVSRTMPAACAVRVRLYLQDTDLRYDQTTFPCNAETVVPLVLSPGETKSLTSGSYFPINILADSVPAAFYRATAVLRITGENPVEIEAGQYRLPNCPDLTRPETCVYTGPPAVTGRTSED
jgi:hypothetical protein